MQNIFPDLDFHKVQSILGEDFDEDIIQDLRYFNSRGRNGAEPTSFNKFYEYCKIILHSNGVVDERRHGSADMVYLNRSTVTSIRDVRN